MLTDTAAIRTYFAKLGLEAEIADIYLALYRHGPQTISALSRNAQVERTRIYRLIDRLLDSNLVELEAGFKRGIIKAAPISNLRILINQREQELRNLTDELELIEQVISRNSVSNRPTHVQLASGQALVRALLTDIVRNAKEARQTVLVCNVYVLDRNLGDGFAAQWLADLEAAHVPCHTAENDDMVTWLAYDTTVVYVQEYATELFATRISDKAVADTYGQLFALMTKS